MAGRMSYLGEFEQVVLLAVARLKGDAHGMGLRAEIAKRLGRSSSIGAVYATLDRLEAKGLVASARTAGEASRRVFTVTPRGARALAASRAMRERLWQGVDLAPLLPRGAR